MAYSYIPLASTYVRLFFKHDCEQEKKNEEEGKSNESFRRRRRLSLFRQ